MTESISEINYDYVNQKLLYLLLIRCCSVVIRPFEYSEKLDGLFELLRAFYVIEEIDMSRITDPSHLDGFFSSYDDNEKKSILLLKNVSQGTMDEVVKYPEILFIALEKDLGIDYSEFKRIAVFNKKTKKFSSLVPKSLISANSLAYKWIGEKVISSLKNDGLFEVKDYLSHIYEKVVSLFELLPAISKQLYTYFGSKLTSQEQKAVTVICERYYNVKLPDYTKKTVKATTPKEEKMIEVDKIEKLEKLEKLEKFEKITEIEEVKEVKDEEILINDEIPPEQNIDETQINQEVWDLINKDNGSSGYNALSLALADIEIPHPELFTSPERKYYYLRISQWKTQIPFTFFKKLFLCYVREEIKSDNVFKSDINRYLMDKHAHLADICSMIASPEFKHMDPTEFEGDEMLRSYLKKEPIISHILPVQKHIEKSIPPSDLFISALDLGEKNEKNEKDDFNTQYQKNLERLKKEYCERVINSQLVDKLRTHTKDLQNRITSLFQD